MAAATDGANASMFSAGLDYLEQGSNNNSKYPKFKIIFVGINIMPQILWIDPNLNMEYYFNLKISVDVVTIFKKGNHHLISHIISFSVRLWLLCEIIVLGLCSLALCLLEPLWVLHWDGLSYPVECLRDDGVNNENRGGKQTQTEPLYSF